MFVEMKLEKNVGAKMSLRYDCVQEKCPFCTDKTQWEVHELWIDDRNNESIRSVQISVVDGLGGIIGDWMEIAGSFKIKMSPTFVSIYAGGVLSFRICQEDQEIQSILTVGLVRRLTDVWIRWTMLREICI